MADFAYTAKSSTGEKLSGMIAAGSRAEAMQKLRAQSMFPMSVQDAAPAAKSISIKLPVRVKKDQVADFCSQLADLLSNGVPMLESLKILSEATENPKLQETCIAIHDAVSQGDTLDVAMGKHPTIFSELTMSMIRAGQEGAFLEEALQRTSHFLRKQDEMRSKIIGALTYPIILGVVGSIIVAAMVVFLVPKFQPFFDRLEQNGTGNLFETIVVLSQRSNQIATELRTELGHKLEEFVAPTDSLDEVFENREQIEISKFYERLPKPHSIAIAELKQNLLHIYEEKPAAQVALERPEAAL